jgi:pyridoxamine 5'-phosphate oxidase
MMNDTLLSHDPLTLFSAWYEEMRHHPQIMEPTAMVLATVGASGRPSLRMVLLKQFDQQGFVFYSNYQSRKGVEIAENPQVALLFWWPPLSRQVRIEGEAKMVTSEQSDQYFQSRPRGSQLSALISPQSQVIPDRDYLKKSYQAAQDRYAHQVIPRPAFWGGYCVVPDLYEFWDGRPNRLHDRFLYSRQNDQWILQILAP